MIPSPRRSPIPWWGRLLQPWVAATVFIAWYLWQAPHQWQYDSKELYYGCGAILDWLQGRTSAIGQTRQFPLFQYLSGVPALWATRRGFPIDISILWCTCSLLSLAGTILMFHRIARRMNRPALGWAAMVVMLSGLPLMYANNSFNEMVGAFLILAFTAAVTSDRSEPSQSCSDAGSEVRRRAGSSRALLCMFLFFLAGITKETAPAILALIWIGGLWINRSRQDNRQRLSQFVALILSLAITISTNAAFNYLRYHSVWNLNYLQPHELIRPWSWRLQYCVALWLSPNGGLLFFWPTFVIAIVSILITALRNRQSPAPAILTTLLLIGLTFGLSGWYEPFGWAAWGPRLLLPWLPAWLLILLRGYPDTCTRLVDRALRTSRAFRAAAFVIFCSALPQIIAAGNPAVCGRFFANDPQFPHGASALDPAQKYARNLFLAWEKLPPLLTWPMLYQLTPLTLAGAFCFLLALLSLLRKCRAALGANAVQPLRRPHASAHCP